MKLHVRLPDRELLTAEAIRVRAVGREGSFCLLPRHRDWVTVLPPGLLAWIDAQDQEHHLAVDSGVLLKCADEVRVSVRRAVAGDDLAQLQRVVEREFLRVDELTRGTRDALARLEAGVVRRFVDLSGRQP